MVEGKNVAVVGGAVSALEGGNLGLHEGPSRGDAVCLLGSEGKEERIPHTKKKFVP